MTEDNWPIISRLKQETTDSLVQMAEERGVCPKRGKRERVETYRTKVMRALILVMSREASDVAQGEFPVLREGHIGPAVRRLQVFMRTAPTGKMGMLDTLGVQELQAHWGLPVTGITDEALWRKIYVSGYTPMVVKNPWFHCRVCGVSVPDKRDFCFQHEAR